MRAKVIINARIVAPEKIIKGEIKISRGKIAEIGKTVTGKNLCEIIDARGKYILPGFVDIHSNGAAGFDVSCGAYIREQDKFSMSRGNYFKAMDKAIRFYLSKGTSKIILAGNAAPVNRLIKSFGLVAEYKNSDSRLRDVLYGIYVEGTFIKSLAAKGAQNSRYFVKPSFNLIGKMQRASGNLIRIVNLPPEWKGEINNLIRKVSSEKIICAIGHSSARGNEYTDAVKSGSVLATHFLNSPSSASFKPFNGGGVVEAQLKSKDVYAEIIPDGYHVDKAYILDTIARKGYDKIIAVSDSMFVTGLSGMKSFMFMGREGEFSKNSGFIYIRCKPVSLFGSVLTMDKAFSNLLTWMTENNIGVWHREHKALKFEDAVVLASKMCSGNAADLLSRCDPEVKFGRLQTGCDADLMIADIIKKKNNYTLKIDNRFLAGILVK